MNTDLHDFEDVVGGPAGAKAWPARIHHVIEAVPWSERRRLWEVWFSIADGGLAADLELQKTDETFLDVDGPVLVRAFSLNVKHLTFHQPESPTSSLSQGSER